MKELILALAFLFVVADLSMAQKGTAGSGYWPVGYTGNTWTGIVTSVDEEKRELTLTYTGKKKTETFTGTLEEIYPVEMKARIRPIAKLSDLLGKHITVYYLIKGKKDASGVKYKIHEIFQYTAAKKRD